MVWLPSSRKHPACVQMADIAWTPAPSRATTTLLMISIAPIASDNTLPAATGPVGGDPVAFPQAGSAAATIINPVDLPAALKSSRRFTVPGRHPDLPGRPRFPSSCVMRAPMKRCL